MPDPQIRTLATPPAEISQRSHRPQPQVPDHELLRLIGSGAYGEVWLACNVIGLYRAVKIVYRDSFLDNRPYEREFRGIQKFEPISRSNDGFVDILQIGRNDEQGYFYYVMELADDANAGGAAGNGPVPVACRAAFDEPAPTIAGASPQSLKEWMGEIVPPDTTRSAYTPKTLRTVIQQCGRLPLEECLRYALSLNLALGHLHRQGLIHRDIKPSNIIFVRGVPKLADIGLVTEVGEACSWVGTEGFVPPEGPNSPRSDIYGLGKVVYEMSMGKDRTQFPEPFTAMGQSPDSAALEELNVIIVKACAPDPRERYQTAEEMHVDLALMQSGKSVKWKRVIEKRLAFARRAGAVVGVIAALATSAFLYQRHQTREAKRLQHLSESLANLMQIQNAEHLFALGESSLALAHLAQVLRRDPENRVAAERIMAALTQRNFPRLSIPPLVHPTKLERLRASRSPARLSPDGERIAAISGGGTVWFWNAHTGERSAPPHAHKGAVYSVEFSPDGRKLASASEDGTVCILDSRSGALHTAPLPHGGTVYSATFSPNGRWLATASADSHARIFDADTGALVGAPLEHTSEVNAVAFSPDCALLATATEADGALIWGVESHQVVHRFPLGGPVRLVRFSGNGKWLAATIYEQHERGVWRVQVWDVQTGEPLEGPLLHENRIYSLAFSPDSRLLVTGTGNNVARVWDVESRTELFQLRHASGVYSAAFSPDGSRILTASVDGKARLWDSETGMAMSEPMQHEGRVIYAEFSRDGEYVLTAGWQDCTIKLWNVGSPRPAHRILGHGAWVVAAEFDAAGGRALTVTGSTMETANREDSWRLGAQQSVTVWDVRNDIRSHTLTLPKGVQALAGQFTPTGVHALLSERGGLGPTQLWELETDVPIGEKINHPTPIVAAICSADGSKFAIATGDGVIHVRDAQSGETLTVPILHRAKVNSVRFSPDATRVITASDDGTAIIWDAVSGKQLTPPLEHKAEVWFAQFSPNQNRVVTVSLDFTARIWTTNAALIAELRHGAPVEYAEFSADETKAVTASGDRTARLWDAATGQQVTQPLRHAELVSSARFSRDGLRVVTASKDGTAQVWDVATGLKLGDPLRHKQWVVSASFSPDGRQVLTASLDRTATVWEVPVATSPIQPGLAELAEACGGQHLIGDRLEQISLWEQTPNLQE